MSTEIIISYYSARSLTSLQTLLAKLWNFRAMITVVINGSQKDPEILRRMGVRAIVRENEGMNIGAWNSGYSERCDASLYIFLQDECYLRQPDFIQVIEAKFLKSRSLGLLGESLNGKWCKPWAELKGGVLNAYEPDHFIDGKPAKRVDTYLHVMRSWGIAPGDSGAHLRSLMWAIPGKIMREIGGFPVGTNRGECIAAEIAVSRKIIEMGYAIDQISTAPFSFFGHSEWRLDGLSKLY
jgi:hypothetical protein